MKEVIRRCLGFLFLGIGCFCACQALKPHLRHNAAISAAARAETGTAATEFVFSRDVQTTPIQDIRVGQRVLAHNPEVTDAERRSWGEEPDFSRWLHLKLEMPKDDGSILHINILRPEQWVESQLGFVVSKADESSRHAPRDEAQRDQPSPTEGNDHDESAPQIVLSEEPVQTVVSSVERAGSPAMPHHAERDGYVARNQEQRDDAPATATTDHDERQVVTATFRHLPSTQVLDVGFVSEHEWRADRCRRQASRDESAEPSLMNDFESSEPNDAVIDAETSNDSARSIQTAYSAAHRGERDAYFGKDTIGVTDNHLFWSVDQQEFVQIGQMEIGERVQTFHGETKRLASKLPRPGPPQEVYNLEVYGEHVYFVGDGLLLAHNMCDARRARLNEKFGRTGDLHADINARGGLSTQGTATLGRRARMPHSELIVGDIHEYRFFNSRHDTSATLLRYPSLFQDRATLMAAPGV